MHHPPIKRHDNLKPLSRDHYTGLVQAKHLRQAASGDADRRRAAMHEFLQEWMNVTSHHFADEERLLAPLIPDEAQKDRLYEEHAYLRRCAEDAAELLARSASPEPAWLEDLGQRMHDHIRWEERELFPLIEQSAGEAALAALEDEAERIESTRPRWSKRSAKHSAASDTSHL